MTFFTSAIAGVLTDQLGIRTTALTGALLASGGMLASSFFCQSVGKAPHAHCECISLSVCFPGWGFVFHVRYHVRRWGFLGLHTVSGHTRALFQSLLGRRKRICYRRQLSFLFGYAPYSARNYHSYSVEWVSVVLIRAVVCSNWYVNAQAGNVWVMRFLLAVCALMFQPVSSASTPKKRQSLGKSRCGSIINTSLFKRKRYLVWTIATPIAFGYFVPYVHNVMFVQSTLPEGDGKLLITFIAVMSLVSRICCGLLADLPSVNTIILQQVKNFGLLGVEFCWRALIINCGHFN